MSSASKPLQSHHGEVPHIEELPPTPMEKFLNENFRKLVILALLVAAGAVVFGVVRHKQSEAARLAGQKLVAAKTVEDCDIVIQDHPGSTVAGNALLMKADLLWKQNKKDSAIAALREFASKHGKHPLADSGQMSLASRLDSTGDSGGAKEIFQKIANAAPASPFKAFAEVRLAEMTLAEGKTEDAKKSFEMLPSKAPGDYAVKASTERLGWITAALPAKEVDGPPKPKPEEKKSADAPPGAPGGPPKIEVKPDGLTTGAMLTPAGTAVTTPAIKIEPQKIDPKNLPQLPKVTPKPVELPKPKMIEPGLAPPTVPAAESKPAAPDASKPPVPAASPAAPPKPDATVKPSAPPAPAVPAPGEAKK